MKLPTYAGTLEDYTLTGSPLVPRTPKVPLTRTAFAAAHVISDPLAERDPWQGRPAVDWDATLKFREGLWHQGLHLAEAMDTAQRGMGVDWPTARELIERTMRAAKAHPAKPRVACGAGTDHVPVEELTTLDSVRDAYLHQMEAIEAAGGQLILMATRALPALKATPDDYARLYDDLITQAQQPVILHWLGDMFDPSLKGYWGSDEIEETNKTVHDLIARNVSRIDGIKISLLNQSHEEAFRANLPANVRLYTGDDFNYAPLIEGTKTHHSHALLGIFAAIAPAASQALEALAQNDAQTYHALLAPTVPLSREIFKAPTQFYKTGIAFLSWLNGSQTHFIMPGGFQSSRDISHLAEVFRLADQARLLTDPDRATHKMRNLLALHGIEG
ncbi:dihydrodipicolinate synthase family protein [Gymnodinialimonas sp.]